MVWLLAGVLRACSKPGDPLCCADRILILASSCAAFTTPPSDRVTTHGTRPAPTAWPATPAPRPHHDRAAAAAPPAAAAAPQLSPSRSRTPVSTDPCSSVGASGSPADGAGAGDAPDEAALRALELAKFAQVLLSPLDEQFTEALLLLCSSAEVPSWMRAACLISACMSVRASPPSDGTVTRAMLASEHVLFSLQDDTRFASVHAAPPAAAGGGAALLQQLLSDACMQPLHSPQSEMLSAVVLHVAMHVAAAGHRRPQTLCMRHLHAADPAHPHLFSLPLGRPGRSLLICKVTIPRGSNHVKSKILHGWSLNIKQTPEAEVSKRPGAWLPVSLFLQNHLPMMRKASVIVGLLPAPPEAPGEGASEARVEEHLDFMRALQMRCGLDDLLDVEGMMPLTWPVLLEALQEVEFVEPHVCWGYSTLRMPPEQQRLVKRCCLTPNVQEWGGRVAYAFACVQNTP